jgi:hypothetical protein
MRSFLRNPNLTSTFEEIEVLEFRSMNRVVWIKDNAFPFLLRL